MLVEVSTKSASSVACVVFALAIPALVALHPGRTAPIEIRTVRPATDDEIELMNWHQEMTEDPAPDQSDWV